MIQSSSNEIFMARAMSTVVFFFFQFEFSSHANGTIDASVGQIRMQKI